MKTKKSTTEIHLTTVQKLNLALATIEEPLRTELENYFYLSNPIQFAAELISLELPLEITRQLLILKVSVPPKRKGEDLEVLAEKALSDWWARLAKDNGSESNAR